MKLSQHLDLSEVIRSDTAKRKGINNMPPPEHIRNLTLLAERIFEPIRNHFGVPINVSSGYRSKALNEAVGGSKTSQHCSGEALDLDMDGSSSGVTNAHIFNFIKGNLQFDQLIWEFGNDQNPDWVHVSYESTGRQKRQVLRAVRVDGITKYLSYR